MPPPTLVCYICGREFGSASLKIHQEQCKQLWVDREALKAPKDRLPLPQPPKENAVTASREQQNEAAMETYVNEALVACQWCGRKFVADRLVVHNRSCTQENPARRVGEATKVKCLDQVLPAPRSPATEASPSPASQGHTRKPAGARPLASRTTEQQSPGESPARSGGAVAKKISRAADFAAAVEDCSRPARNSGAGADAESIDGKMADLLLARCDDLEGLLHKASAELKALRSLVVALRKA